jgi:hypothetical protein
MLPLPNRTGELTMPNYEIHYVGGDHQGRGHTAMYCVDDAQALRWASGLLRDALTAEVWSNGRKVGWVGSPESGISPV